MNTSELELATLELAKYEEEDNFFIALQICYIDENLLPETNDIDINIRINAYQHFLDSMNANLPMSCYKTGKNLLNKKMNKKNK